MTKRTHEQKLLYYTRPHFYKKILADLDMMEEKVCWLLGKYEKLRNNDKLLVFKYWTEVDQVLFTFASPHEIINQVSNPYDIIRQRQIIQNQLNLWQPTDPDVVECRQIKEAAMLEWVINQKKINGVGANEF